MVHSISMVIIWDLCEIVYHRYKTSGNNGRRYLHEIQSQAIVQRSNETMASALDSYVNRKFISFHWICIVLIINYFI